MKSWFDLTVAVSAWRSVVKAKHGYHPKADALAFKSLFCAIRPISTFG
jgi:hypothetical protein